MSDNEINTDKKKEEMEKINEEEEKEIDSKREREEEDKNILAEQLEKQNEVKNLKLSTRSKSEQIIFEETQILTKMSIKKKLEDKEKILFKKQKKKKRIFLWNFIILCLNMFFYSMSIFSQFEIEKRFKVIKKIKSTFGFDTSSNKEYYPIEETYQYIINMIENLTQFEDNKFILDNKYQIISDLRITQRKIRLKQKDPLQPLINHKLDFPKWSSDTINPEKKYDTDIEDIDPISSDFVFNEKDSYLKKGGFVIKYYFNDTEDNGFEDKLGIFINKYTSVLTTDFTLNNFENKYFCTIVIKNQIYDFGVSTVSFEIYINERDLYQSKWSKFNIFFQIAFVVCYILSVVFFFLKIQTIIDLKKEEIENKEKKKKNKRFLHLIQKLSATKIIFTNIFNIIQLINIILNLLTIIYWIIYIVKMSKLNPELDKAERENYTISNETQNKLIEAGKILTDYKKIIIVSIFFIFLNLIEIAGRLSRKVKMFIRTIEYSFEDILSFFIFLLIILLGFATFAWLYFGRRLKNFYTLADSFQQNFAFFLGIIDSDIFFLMYSSWGAMSCCYFIILIVIVRFIISKIILAILLHNYNRANTDYLKSVSFQKITETKGHKVVIRKHFVFTLMTWYSFFVNGILDFISCKKEEKKYELYNEDEIIDDAFKCDFSKEIISKKLCPEIQDLIHEKKEKIKKEGILRRANRLETELDKEDEYNYRRKEKVNKYLISISKMKKIELVDSRFEEDYEFLMRNAYFDSALDIEKVKKYYEKKYRRFFFQALFYLIFVAILIIVYLLNILAPWKFHILHAVGTAFNSTQDSLNSVYNIKNENDSENEKILNWSVNIPIKEINSVQQIIQFTFEHLQNYFELKNISGRPNDVFLDNNYLLADTILMTMRREKKSRREEYIKKNKENITIRHKENFYLNYIDSEEKSYFTIDLENETQYFQWDEYHTYKKYGGYHFEYKLKDKVKYNNNKNFQNDLINEYTNFFIIEFFLQNYEYEVVVHVSIIFTFDYGGFFKTNFNAQLLKYKNIIKPLDVVKIFFEIVFLILFAGVIIFFIKSIKENIFAYNKWYRDIIAPLNIKIRDIRNKIEPEFIRKILVVFGIQQVFEIIIIGFSIAIIYAIIVTMVKEHDLNKLLKTENIDLYKIRDCLYKGEDMRNIIENFGVIVIFLSCIKLFTLINLGKFFSLLIRTFDNSKTNILIFIVIIVLIHPSFIFYSHLAFGEYDPDFYTVEATIKTCLKSFFGYINFLNLKKDDKAFGPIFFFIYMICINLILLNLFVSILYSSYILIKKEIVRRTEIWNPLNVFCVWKKRKISSNTLNKNLIYSEFDYDKSLNKFNTNTLIYKENFSYEDFLKHEKEQINYLNDELYTLKKRRHDATLAYDNNLIGKVFVFEDNIYQHIKKVHLRGFIIDEYNRMLNICENLDRDILSIDEAIEHLIKHENLMKYDNLIKNIEEKNNYVKEKAKKLDEEFLKLYNDLKKINLNNLEMENLKMKKAEKESLNNSNIMDEDNKESENSKNEKEKEILNNNNINNEENKDNESNNFEFNSQNNDNSDRYSNDDNLTDNQKENESLINPKDK